MKISKTYTLDFMRFASMLGGGYSDEEGANITSDEEIIRGSIVHFIENDKNLISEIHSLLVKRLKFSTGKLYDSIKLSAIDLRADKRYKKSTSTQIGISVDIDSNDRSLINALLGEKDLDADNPIPSLDTLTKYVRGKRKYFNDNIDAIERRHDTTRMLLQAQKRHLNEGARFHVPNKQYEQRRYQDPVVEIAHKIRLAMIERQRKGKSPTKGSEYVFMGNYPQYSGDKEKYSFKPIYTKLSTPLLSRRVESTKGEIGKLLETRLIVYVENILNKYAQFVEERFDIYGHPKEGSGKLASKIASRLRANKLSKGQSGVVDALCLLDFSESMDTGKQIKLILDAERIISENMESIKNNKTVAAKRYRQYGEHISREVVNALMPKYTDAVERARKETVAKIREASKNVLEMAKFIPDTRKRRARRRR